MDEYVLKRLLAASKGEEPLDAVIVNGRIVNVFTNAVDEGRFIGIKDGFIVSINNASKEALPAAGRVIDAEGRYLCPGFIDGHTHIDSIFPFYEMVPWSLRGGTTTVVTECAMVANACGMDMTLSFVESTKGYPLRCYFLAPPLTPPLPEVERAKGITFKEFASLLKRDDFLGIGEGYWNRIVDGDARVMKQAALAIHLGKTLEGHGAGARGPKLVQYVTTGITSCHESITTEEAVEKLRLGLHVMIREGFVRRELAELSHLKDIPVDMRRVMLVSDVFDAVMLIEEGYLDSVVRRAIAYGFAPIEAIKMASINVADYYGLRHLGAIAPLRHADILFLDRLDNLSIRKVMANGEMLIEDGQFKGTIKPYRYPAAAKKTVTAKPLKADDLRVKAGAPRHKVRIIQVANETITREAEAVLEAPKGFLEANPAEDIAYVAVINRYNSSLMGKGFIKGTGIKEGAFATTMIWDTCNILAIGSSIVDIQAVVNRLISVQGGIVVSSRGKVIYEFAMPVYGLIPLMGMEEVRGKTKALDGAMAAIGASIPRPFLSLQTIPFTGLPFLRITDKGLVDIRQRKLVPLIIE
jgi:adenine deaminase